MKIHEFLHFNRTCPVCEEPLSLYLQWMNSTCFKAKIIDHDTYKLEQCLCIQKDFNKDDYMILHDMEDAFSIQFNTSKIREMSKMRLMYFFFLCNHSGLKENSPTDCEISLYTGCYYRQSASFEYKKDPHNGKVWHLELVEQKDKDLINRNESFSFNTRTAEVEKVYMIDLDHQDKKTTFWYYTVNEEERKIPYFKPKILEKEMPLLTVRPKLDLQDREKLLSRLNSWVILS